MGCSPSLRPSSSLTAATTSTTKMVAGETRPTMTHLGPIELSKHLPEAIPCGKKAIKTTIFWLDMLKPFTHQVELQLRLKSSPESTLNSVKPLWFTFSMKSNNHPTKFQLINHITVYLKLEFKLN